MIPQIKQNTRGTSRDGRIQNIDLNENERAITMNGKTPVVS